MTLRTRCLVLRQVEFLGNATLDQVVELLPELSRDVVQKAFYNLLAQDRIFKAPDKVKGKSGRPQFCYFLNPDWSSDKPRTLATGRKNYSESMQTNTRAALGHVPFRDRKIKLLIRLIDYTHDSERDLMIGLLADLGHVYKVTA